MLSRHVVKSCVIKYVSVTYDGGVSRREIAGVLLNDGGVVIESQGNPDAKREQGSGEAPNATERIDRGDSGGKRRSSANCNPNVWWGDVEEPETCCG